jgi:Ni/Fe-hydrogenase 1 B-type cytochrome subunit
MSKYSFRTYQPLSLRLWHWLNAGAVLGLLGTVFLRKTLLSWRTNSALIEARLKDAGTIISPELAKDIAVGIRDPLWDWHIYLGFTLGALLLGRISIVLFVEKRLPGVQAFKGVLRLNDLPPQERGEALHYFLVKIGYATFYLIAALTVVLGFMLTFKAELGFSKDFIGAIKETHELMMWFFVLFVGGHLTGVVVAENRKDPGLISDMVHGGDKPGQPDGG